MRIAAEPFTANGRRYASPPRPVVVVCLDGCADEYLSSALVLGRMPHLGRMLARHAYRGLARSALPSFTNVNVASLVTGVPPSVHGISGNFFLDPATDEAVMMNSASYLRAETILAAAARAGRRVAMVTAKDKLRDLLSAGLRGIAFSAERAGDAREDTHGIGEVERLVGAPTPSIYSADASLFVLRAGVALLRERRADLLFLALADTLQHRYPPGAQEVLDFYQAVDLELGRLLELGAVVGMTADHGMNAKHDQDGTPNVVYLERLLSDGLGTGCRIILPITDPYVLHHGALGSFAVVHLPPGADVEAARRRLLEVDGITEVHDRATAARKLELPADRIGDLVVLSGRHVALGRAPEHHDLTGVREGLRSHGGRYEEMVPLLLSGPLTPEYTWKASADPRNFDVFDFTLNGIRPVEP
ncbi:MAG TPA: phosphonoacetate hydrolase [Longimicrobiaceae bacterium]|nr:phosphonoacetate hydrolase [Longimicrobiaceae bacterium]